MNFNRLILSIYKINMANETQKESKNDFLSSGHWQ